MFQFLMLAFAVVLLAAEVTSLQETNSWYNEGERGGLEWLFKKGVKHASSQSSKNEILNEPSMKKTGYSVCRTKECFRTAGELWESMNSSIDPCVDFHEYACGNWKERHPVPPTEKTWSPLQMIQADVQSRIRDLIEEDSSHEDVLPVKVTKRCYQACMDIGAIEERGIRPLQSLLSMTGGWPMIMEENEWEPKEFTWQQVADFYGRMTGDYALFKIGGDQVYDFETEKMKFALTLSSSKPPIHIPWNYNRSQLYHEGKYANYMKKVALDFAKSRGSGVKEESIVKDIDDVIEFEKKLSEEIEDATYSNEMPLKEFIELYNNETQHSENSKINWLKRISNIMQEIDREFDASQNITILEKEYFLHLAEVLEEASPRTVVNYIQWKFLSGMLKYTTERMQTLEFEVTKDMFGIKEQNPRWKHCVETISQDMTTISYLFVKKYFTKEMKRDAEKMVADIRKAMKKKISKADWLDDKTRESMIQKVDKVKANIGYPEWYDNRAEMNKLVKGMIVGDEYFNTVLSYRKYHLKKELRKIGTDKDEESDVWVMDPIIVNAWYDPESNNIVIPAADFDPPLYETGRTATLNYGAIGMIISHEISHGFDPSGHLYNKDGKIHMWSNSTEDAYDKRTECFVRQYDEYHEREAKANNKSYETFGEYTLAENVADSLGEETIYSAFNALEEETQEPRLPGFEHFTNDQMFFISFANLWCEASTPEYERNSERDSHSSSKYRVIAPVQNSENFARAYKCPKGSPMNPVTKCKIW